MKVIKDFPYFSQRDNHLNPSGACNVTSLAMCLYWLGIRGDKTYPQLEDQLYDRCEKRGWSRHDPMGLKPLVESYGLKDNFTCSGTLKDIRDAIDNDIPCVLHGYFTRFGHLIVVKGYTDNAFVVCDPWGEYFESGYDTSVSGDSLKYSVALISRVCSPESVSNPKDIWLHRISKK